MNREILNDYKEKDDKILLAQVSDKIEMCEKRNKIRPPLNVTLFSED